MRMFLMLLFLAAARTLLPSIVCAQQASGTIQGTVTDSKGGILPSARVEIDVQPTELTTVSDSQGRFWLNGIPTGTYTLEISYVGFAPSIQKITVTAGKSVPVTAALQVASESEEVLVTAPRAHGEAEALNEERTTANILDVLPAKVINSLPNANVADAVGRLPSVTLERDEGEGKYVQIRGTEPRLSNLTIDGIEVPSPEGGVRQVKLDTVPADLVQSVQIYKTLEADQPGDAVGGSVNLETKTAGDQPILSIEGTGGFTPIINTVPVYGFGGTAGKRFGANRRLGVLVSGTYDYNGRGIDDVEPVPAILPGTTFTPDFTNMDIREYYYDRKRYGFGGDVDYRLATGSTLWARSLFSDFRDFGHRFDYALETTEVFDPTNPPVLTTERRLGDYQIADAIVGGDHTKGPWTLHWEGSVARSRMLNPINGGESITTFNFIPTSTNCQYDPAVTKNKFLPQFTPACFTELYNPANFQLSSISQANHGLTAQLNLQGSASATRSYTIGSHAGIFQFGAWFSNAHKFDDSYENDFTPNGSVLMTQFVTDFRNPNYYGGTYKYGPGVSWEGVNAYLAANPSAFTASTTAGGNTNNFNLVERIAAGYLMNTLNFGRFTVIAGIRFEGTQDSTLSFDTTLPVPCLCAKGSNSYVTPLPSASLEVNVDSNSDFRFAFARGISRPDPQFLTAATLLDSSTFPPTVTIGNPALKPEHANNYDVLYERYLHPLGAIRVGFFYKSLSDPIVNILSGPRPIGPCPQANCFVSQAENAGNAYIAGFEASFEQHFSYLPGILKGLGLSANYSYAASRAHNVNPGYRIDSPALLRQAPNTWNISPTFDRGRVSLRVGMAYNGANIYQYAFVACQNGEKVDSSRTCIPNANDAVPDPTLGGIPGPSGDVYLFSHFQVDAQGSVYLGKGVTALVSGLNLNNEVFGFYNGSPQFFIQREFYKPTYSFGLRWNLHREQ